MNLGLKNKNALIAASSQGLGKAVAMELAREGANVALCARNEDVLIKTRDQVATVSEGGKIIAVPVDLENGNSVEDFMSSVLKEFGSIDVLVTNAGGPPTGTFEEHTVDAWDYSYRLLLLSAVRMIRAALPGMKKKQWGRIVSITSQAVKQPVETLVLSNSVRASVVGLIRTLANEVGKYGITVNNVMPGYTKTKRLHSLLKSNPSIMISDQIPLRRAGEPEEFASVVAFLASEKASYITGASIPVDGGWIKSIM